MTYGFVEDNLRSRQLEMEACISESAPFGRLRRIDVFVDSLTGEEARGLGATTEEGFSLATLITFLHTYGWSRWQQRIPYEESMYRIATEPLRLHGLVRLGVDVTVPDARGRVAALQAFANDVATLNADDVGWAFRKGMDPLQVESSAGQLRSLLSLSFTTNLRYEEVLTAVHGAILQKLDSLALPQRLAAVDNLLQAPICREHDALKSTLVEQRLQTAWVPADSPVLSAARF